MMSMIDWTFDAITVCHNVGCADGVVAGPAHGSFCPWLLEGSMVAAQVLILLLSYDKSIMYYLTYTIVAVHPS